MLQPKAVRRHCRYHEPVGARELGPGSFHRGCQFKTVVATVPKF